jgi:hypothetical protein
MHPPVEEKNTKDSNFFIKKLAKRKKILYLCTRIILGMISPLSVRKIVMGRCAETRTTRYRREKEKRKLPVIHFLFNI